MPIITVQFIKDVVATPEQKRELIVQLTDKFVEILGDVVRPFVYCIIQETPQQEWGIAGLPMPDLVYLTSEKHAQVIERSNDIMRSVIAQVQTAQPDPAARADAIWRGEALPDGASNSAQQQAAQPNNAEKQRLEANRATVRRFHDAITNNQNGVFYEILRPDFVSHAGAMGDQVGPAKLIDSLRPFRAAFPDLKVTEDYVVAEEDRVATHVVMSGTHKGVLMGAQPTGKTVSWAGLLVYRLHPDGRIIERWQDFDMMSMLQQIGAVPS